MFNKNLIKKAEEQLAKSLQVQQALKEELLFLEKMQQEIKDIDVKKEIHKITSSLKDNISALEETQEGLKKTLMKEKNKFPKK